jgi:hypothetical protein
MIGPRERRSNREDQMNGAGRGIFWFLIKEMKR